MGGKLEKGDEIHGGKGEGEKMEDGGHGKRGKERARGRTKGRGRMKKQKRGIGENSVTVN